MSKLLPYETIIKACEGDPKAVNAVLLHYVGFNKSTVGSMGKVCKGYHLFLPDREIKNIKGYVPQALNGIAHLMIAAGEAK